MYDSRDRNSGKTIEIVPYCAAHLMMMDEQDTEKYWGEVIKTVGYARALEKAGPAHTAMRDGKVLTCVGLQHQWEGRATAWAVMAKHIGGTDYLAIHRATKRFMHLIGYQRIDATVRADFHNAVRWAHLLGFKRETPEPMLNYGPDGSAHYIYSWVAK